MNVGEQEDKLPKEKFAVFMMATFGEGDPTDNAVNFMNWLNQEDLSNDTCSGVPFAVFALGNRQYPKFCEIGIRVSKRLKELGADEILEHGEGDDDGSLDDDFVAWKTKFWPVARARFHVDQGNAVVATSFTPSFELEWVESKAEENGVEEKTPSVVMDPKHSGAFAGVVKNEELRKDASDGSTRHIEIDIANLPLKYRTADNLGVMPHNDYKLVSKLAQRLGVDTRRVFKTKPKEKGESDIQLPFPETCSVGDALLWYCDFTSMPKQSVLETLAFYATSAEDKKLLKHYMEGGKVSFLFSWEGRSEF